MSFHVPLSLTYRNIYLYIDTGRVFNAQVISEGKAVENVAIKTTVQTSPINVNAGTSAKAATVVLQTPIEADATNATKTQIEPASLSRSALIKK